PRIVDGDSDGSAVVDIGAYEYQMQITTTTLPDAVEGVAYSFTVQAAGGNSSNYTWSVSGQPSWLSIDAATGELSGTPPSGSAGTYSFTVTLTDGQQTIGKQFVLVVKLLSVNFEASSTQGTAPLTVNFTDKSRGNVTQWEWDFDNDGTPDSTQQNPTHTYSTPGWYTVKLTVTGPAGSGTCVKEKLILVAGNIWYVDGNGGDDGNSGTGWNDAFATIGKALSVAGDYDLVLVADATYNETDLNFNGKKVYLKGVDHNTAGQQPVIDCQGSGRAFVFGSGETGDSVVDNFVIENGSAAYGGAIYCDGGSPTLTNCTLSGNKATSGNGGAISCGNSSSPTVSNCTFSGNSATSNGGAIYCDGGSPRITNCTFSGNRVTGGNGGAICCENSSSPTVSNCAFSGNSTNFSGGAIYCDGSSPSVTNCTLCGNHSVWDGGAIYCYGSSLTITNCTFSGNSADYSGGAICCDSSTPTLNNCILWGNTASSSGNEIYTADSGSSCTLNCCCVDDTGYGGQTGNITENNCIFAEPQFVDATGGDYHLKPTSPCIDAGDNTLLPSGVTTDLEGNQRIVDGDNDGTATVDIGAYEYQP
ncbi:MAG: hypothetical protein DRP63_06005, partial [Planctomycetota bacterium]